MVLLVENDCSKYHPVTQDTFQPAVFDWNIKIDQGVDQCVLFMNLVVLLGQTCSGKSQMAVDLAKELGESWIVNCDSRQVYRRLDIGTAKVPGIWQSDTKLGPVFVYQDVPHFLIDYLDPASTFSLFNYLQDWCHLFDRYAGKLPQTIILTGGTGLFAKAVLEKYSIAGIKPEFDTRFQELKNQLHSQPLSALQLRAGTTIRQQLNANDWQNPRRLVNCILRLEAQEQGWLAADNLTHPVFERVYTFAIAVEPKTLKQRIQARLQERLEQGLLQEILTLQDLGTQRLLNLGLEYRLTQLFVLGQLNEADWKRKLLLENYQYAKRQMTWLKKQHVHWVTSLDDIRTHLQAAL